MKTLKKVLSLVLVVAMIASMLIVGAAATEETQYPEAVAVVTKLGIIEGDGTGMDYTGNVTREQAAKIVAYMLLGKTTAETLKTTTAPFADVAASRWSAGYIAYLKNQGIISGVTDTEFDPTAPVTGIAFAKMMLTAVGYGKAGEFEGAAWDINTITLANELGIYEGTKTADLAGAATREEAMLYAFNTVANVKTVKYNSTFEAYYVGTTPLDTTAPGKTLGQLNFKLEKGQAGTDALGRPAAVWKVDGTEIVKATATELPVATFTNSVTAAQLYAALGQTVALNLGTYGDTYYIDGVAGNTFPTLTTASAADTKTVVLGGTGAYTEVYVKYLGSNAYDVDIVTYYEYLSTVKNVNAYSVVTLANGNNHSNLSIVAAGFARKDVVLYTVDADGGLNGAPVAVSIKKAETVTGAHTATTALGIIVDGVAYNLRAGVQAPVLANPAKSHVLTLDSLGNVLKIEDPQNVAAPNFNYVYVKTTEADIKLGSLLGDSNKIVAQVVYPTGGKVVEDIAVYELAGYKYIMLNGAPVYLSAITDITATIPEGWYTYTADEAGLSLTQLAVADQYNLYAKTVDTITLTQGLAMTSINGMIVDANTTLTLINAQGVASVVTGNANFVSGTYGAANNQYVLVTYAIGSKVISSITVVEAPAAEAAKDLVYCLAPGNAVYGATEYTVVYKDGTVATIPVATAYSMTAGGVYEVQYQAASYNYKATPANATLVNAGYMGTMEQVGQGYVYKAEATVGAVAGNYFTTTAYTQADVDDGIWHKVVTATTYFYDAATIIVDCTGNGATALTAGDIFVAATVTPAAGAFKDLANYCTYIWIVG